MRLYLYAIKYYRQGESWEEAKAYARVIVEGWR